MTSSVPSMSWLLALPVDGAIVTRLVGTAVTESDGTTTAEVVAAAVAEAAAEVGAAPAVVGTGTAESVVPSELDEWVLEPPVPDDVETCVRVCVGTDEVWTGVGEVLVGLGVTDGVLVGVADPFVGVADPFVGVADPFVGVADPVLVGFAEVETDVLVTGATGVVVTAAAVAAGTGPMVWAARAEPADSAATIVAEANSPAPYAARLTWVTRT
jgi:hypothetical protein